MAGRPSGASVMLPPDAVGGGACPRVGARYTTACLVRGACHGHFTEPLAPRPLPDRRRPRRRDPAVWRLERPLRPFTWTEDPDTIIAKAAHPRRRETQQTSVTER